MVLFFSSVLHWKSEIASEAIRIKAVNCLWYATICHGCHGYILSSQANQILIAVQNAGGVWSICVEKK